MTSYKRMIAGEPLDGAISASTWNALVDNLVRSNTPPTQTNDSFGLSPRVQIKVKNTTGAALGRGAIVGLSAPSISPTANLDAFRGKMLFDAITPTSGDAGRFAVTRGAIPNGDIGVAAIAGAVPVTVDVVDAGHQFADVISGDNTRLRSAASGGARILWKESGTGNKNALIYFPTATVAPAPPSSGMAAVYLESPVMVASGGTPDVEAFPTIGFYGSIPGLTEISGILKNTGSTTLRFALLGSFVIANLAPCEYALGVIGVSNATGDFHAANQFAQRGYQPDTPYCATATPNVPTQGALAGLVSLPVNAEIHAAVQITSGFPPGGVTASFKAFLLALT